MSQVINKPVVGEGATGYLVTDTVAYVVTYVSPSGKTIRVRAVEVSEEQSYNNGAALPIIEYQGLLDKPVGPEYMARKNRRGDFVLHGWEPLSFGESIRRVDMSF